MKRSRFSLWKPLAVTAVGVLLGRGAQADTILTFDALPSGQGQNGPILQSFGDNVGGSRAGIEVVGFGTPDIGLTWSGPGVGGGRWDYYIDAVWSAGQLDGSAVGTTHSVAFTPTATTAVRLRSFNFHPYYNNGLDYAYDWSVTDGANVLASGSISFPCDATKDHPVDIDYTGALDQALTLRITRTGGSDGTQNIAVDDIRFSQLPEPTGPLVTAISPSNGETSTRPDAPFDATITNGVTQLAVGSIQLFLNEAQVVPSVTPLVGAASVSFRPTALLASGSTNRYRLIYADTGGRNFTNDVQFVVVPYENIQLNTPLHLETFDDLAEGELPADWSLQSFSVVPDPNIDFGDLNSAAYANWTVVAANRFTGPLLTYGTHTPETDYQRVLTFNPANVVNGQVLESLAQTNVFFGNSGYRDGGNQIVYAFTRDYDLSGHTNIFISFHSLYEQNQDSMGALEYSIDLGQTWLPVLYLLDGPDIVLDALDNVDAVATFTTPHDDVATYIDPGDGQLKGGNYGAFIGAVVSQDLAPYVSVRVNDDPVESKRVELFRLPEADNQPAVRFRLAYAGTDSWYWGIDHFGLYSLPTVPPTILRQPGNLTRMSANSVARFTVEADGTPPFRYQWRFNGTDLPDATNATLVITNLQLSDSGTYSVRVSNAGGVAVSDGAALSVFEPRVTGQWDFDQGDLRPTVGAPMEFLSDTAQITTFTELLFPMEFEQAPVMCFSSTEITQGYVLRHSAPANGGGANVNQYTLLLDLMSPASSSSNWRALLQTDPQNSLGNDADLYINPANGIGIGNQYDGSIDADTWHRVAFVVDLAAPGSQRLGKFIDGTRVGTQALEGIDGRHSLLPTALLFTTGDRSGVYTQPGYVNSIQFVEGRLSDEAIAALGRAVPTGLPLFLLTIERSGNMVTVRWRGAPNLILSKATRLTNPDWQRIPATLGASSYSEALSGGAAFFRLGRSM
jgi:hypothetical protein